MSLPIDDSFRTLPLRAKGEPKTYAGCPRCGAPLVSTLEFRGAEWICVPCDHLYGYMAPIPVAPSDEIEAQYEAVKTAYDAARAERKAGR